MCHCGERSSERLKPALDTHRSGGSRMELIDCRRICHNQEDVQTVRIEPVFEYVDASGPQLLAIIVQRALCIEHVRRDGRRARLNWGQGQGGWLG